MNPYWLSLTLLVSSILAYQVSQKLLPQLSPWHLLVVVYGVAFVVCLVFALIDARERSLFDSLRGVTWPVFLLAAGVVGIELGWILVIRNGGLVSLTGLIANASVAMLILPIGVFLFRERLHPSNLAGIALCLLGLVLIARK